MPHIIRTTNVYEKDGYVGAFTSPVYDGDARTAHDALAKRWKRMSGPVRQIREENTLSRRVTTHLPELGPCIETVTHLDLED